MELEGLSGGRDQMRGKSDRIGGCEGRIGEFERRKRSDWGRKNRIEGLRIGGFGAVKPLKPSNLMLSSPETHKLSNPIVAAPQNVQSDSFFPKVRLECLYLTCSANHSASRFLSMALVYLSS